jgi:PPOX class probable F420-dependent enzyme
VDLLVSARVARLALTDVDDRPRVLPITFAVAGDSVWSAIDNKPKRTAEPARVRWLRRRPEAALCVDRYADEWAELAWVQLLGRIDVLDLDEGAPGLAALRAKYRQYESDPPPGPLLRLGVDRALAWRAEDAGRRHSNSTSNATSSTKHQHQVSPGSAERTTG